MFCVLTAESGKRRRGMPTYRKPKIMHIEYGDSHYDIIRTKVKKGKINLSAAEKAIEGRPVIKQVDINLPTDSSIRLFDSRRYRQHLEISTSLEVLKLAGKFKRSISVALIDRDGGFCGCLAPLMILSNEVYIITNDIDRYSQYANECFAAFGAAPIVTDGYGAADKCSVVFSPAGVGLFDRDKVVFAPKKECWHIDSGCIAAIDGCAAGVDKIDFAGALYELCGISRMGSMTASFMTANGVREPLDSIARRICLDIK